MHEQKETAAPIELWCARKGDRELRCQAVYLTHGVDVRLMEGQHFRRTQLCRDAPTVEALSEEWRKALTECGWRSSPI